MTNLNVVLGPVIEALAADGYDTEISDHDDTITVQIMARADACSECLSPPEILKPIIAGLLHEAGVDKTVHVGYPPDWNGRVPQMV